jgi:hypothetical protein
LPIAHPAKWVSASTTINNLSMSNPPFEVLWFIV